MRILNALVLYIASFFLSVYPFATYTEGVVGQPVSFFPHKAASQNDVAISKLIYRGLFTYDQFGTLLPDLAESWQIEEDGLVYTITLKKDQKWSDGNTITADDLIYTAFKTESLQGVATDKVDDYTVRFTLPNKFSPFLGLLTMGIMQSGSEENYNPLTPVSSADFKVLRVEYSGPAIKEVILYNTKSTVSSTAQNTVNSNGGQKVKKLVFRYYNSENELATAAKLGEIDGFISREDFEIENFTKQNYPLQGVYFALFFNLRNDSVKSKELRQKLQAALPINELIADRGISVQGPISRSPFTSSTINFTKYNDKLKKEDLDIKLTLTIPDTPQHLKTANLIKNYWKNTLGIDLTILPVDPKVINQTVIEPRNFEILFYGKEVDLDPDRYFSWHSTQKEHPGQNITGFDQIRADRALEEGRSETDFARRLVHYNEFQKAIDEQVPAIFLYHPYIKYYVSNKISGVGDKSTFFVGDRFLDFDNWVESGTN